MTNTCPICKEELLRDYGELESNIILVGSAPSDEELHYHKMFTGAVGQILRREMYKWAGLELTDCHITSVYFHEKKKKKDKECLDLSSQMCLEKIKGKNFIVLIGAHAVTWATGLSIDDVNGLDVTRDLTIEHNPYTQRFFALVNPSSTFSSGLGELRFGLKNLKEWISSTVFVPEEA